MKVKKRVKIEVGDIVWYQKELQRLQDDNEFLHDRIDRLIQFIERHFAKGEKW